MKINNLAGTTAFAALMSGTVAFADITPEEVWQNWQDLATSNGQTMTATSAARDGDTLAIVGMTATFTQDATVITSNYDTVNFLDNGDGTVSITMSDVNPTTITTPAAGDVPAVDLVIEVSQPGMTIVASGSADETNYAFTAPTIGINVKGIDANVETVTASKLEATMTEVSGAYTVSGPADGKKLDSSFAAKSIAIAMAGTDTANGGSDINVTASIADLAGTSKGTFIGVDTMENFADALKAGFTADANFSHGAVSYDISVVEAGAPTKVAGAIASGDMSFKVDTSQLQFGTANKGVTLAMQSPDIPFPEVKVSYAEAGFNLVMPVTKSDTPANFAFLSKIVDLTVSDEIWGMIDPAAALPHDPATVIIDTKGTATMTVDIMDEAAMAEAGEAPPGMINSLDITELKATIAGAALTGAGAFTFDNSDMTTFAGVPAPTGKIDLKLIGANGLADKLVAMGLLSADDVAGVRMMSAMFANAGPGEDELNSTLEFKDKGFFANGQQLQ